jgi:signal transduction histidine kinase
MENNKNILVEFEDSIKRITEYRNRGNLDKAVQECLTQIELNNSNDFKLYYSSELAEIYSLLGNFEKSVTAYITTYNLIGNDSRMFKVFAKSIDRYAKKIPSQHYEILRQTILDNIHKYHIEIAYQYAKLFDFSVPLEDFLSSEGKQLAQLLSKDNYFDGMVNNLKELEKNTPSELLIILDTIVLDRKRVRETLRIDKYCITVYERLEKYYKAQKIASELIQVEQDSVTIRSLFRLCRKIDNYDLVNQLLLKYPNIEYHNDFNIQYELVYYYDKINNTIGKKDALNKIESYHESLPILRTLKNLYLRFGTLEDVLRVERIIEKSFNKKRSRSKEAVVQESEANVWSALENSKRLEALANLTQGISHELGQPITNIRFMIQYYMHKDLEKLSGNTINELFQTVLMETERMGNLMDRLSPITTAKNTIIVYNLMDRIRQRFKAEVTRLKSEKIIVTLPLNTTIEVQGDPGMLDQIISNLLINSIHSLHLTDHTKKEISIRVTEEDSKIRISFQDNGIGITQENRSKIFEPFFTTKPTGEGQGLGLFIIWNLLKYQGGTIFLDYKYNNGARFIIELPKEAKKYE